MKNVLKSWFTLIELLVVITIIGILATGAVTVYTSQIQKARDSTRTTDVKALQWAIEQFYGDKWEYPSKSTSDPDKFFGWVTAYIQTPSDPKSGQAWWTAFDYLYNVSADANTIPNQEFEVSTTYEQTANRTEKAGKDWWDDSLRLEIGVTVNDPIHRTVVNGRIPNSGAWFPCVSAVTWSGANLSASILPSCSDGDVNPLLIRKQ